MELRVQYLSKRLRHHFKSRNLSLSAAGSNAEAFEIVAVKEGYRCSCLLSSCRASKEVLEALHDSLREDHEGVQLAILVLQPSQQIFVVNIGLLVKRYKDGLGPVVYYAIDVEMKEVERVQYDTPACLQTHLSLCSILTGKVQGRGSVPIILLGSAEDTSLHGVALAGWLLGYHIVYFFKMLSPPSDSCCHWSMLDPLIDQSWSETEMSFNSLAGVQLVLVKIYTSDGLPLYQYTFPSSITKQVSHALDVGQSLTEIIEAIQKKTKLETGHSIQVTHELVTRDRVAL